MEKRTNKLEPMQGERKSGENFPLSRTPRTQVRSDPTWEALLGAFNIKCHYHIVICTRIPNKTQQRRFTGLTCIELCEALLVKLIFCDEE